MKILVTNDDGIQSQGIIVLAKVLREVGDVVVIAPDREKSATAHSLTLHRPLRVEKIRKNVYAVDGTPADCVHLAVNGILSEGPQLVVSGINKGPNLGNDITYSGTVSAAFEGTLLGIPSFAISLASRSHFKFRPAARFAARVARHLMKKGLPRDTFLNINVPNLDEKEIRSYKITRQGRYHVHGSQAVEKVDPRGRKYYWIGGGTMVFDQRGETDHEAVSEGFISITPLHIDLTSYASIQELRKWKL
ncbi:MAG: 5'/3'-nucleotidase SurE [Deltaproteobacteria bacterium RBG_13_52_11b]|nr:MAG: 5'/3'-nucleotidase SurE [Deltaproteobacteria bacterium RBG_13_52_11b]